MAPRRKCSGKRNGGKGLRNCGIKEIKCDRKGNRVKGSWTHCVGLVGLDLWSKPSWLLDSLITWFRLSWLLGQGLGSLGESILWSLPKTLNPLVKPFLGPWSKAGMSWWKPAWTPWPMAPWIPWWKPSWVKVFLAQWPLDHLAKGKHSSLV